MVEKIDKPVHPDANTTQHIMNALPYKKGEQEVCRKGGEEVRGKKVEVKYY
jgi:hypothetical protein